MPCRSAQHVRRVSRASLFLWAIVIALIAATSENQSPSKDAEAEASSPHRRVKRTLEQLCGSEQFVNALARTVMDESRPLLASTEPLVLGDGPEWRGVRLQRGRLWGASSMQLREPLLLRCDRSRMAVAMHVALTNSEIAYDWQAPDNMLGSRGMVSLFAREMSLKTAVTMPRQLGSRSPVQVMALRITELRGADVNVTGPWPLAPILAATANLLLKTFPDQARALMSSPLRDGVQQYLDELLT